jgi:cation transport ATPase
VAQVVGSRVRIGPSGGQFDRSRCRARSIGKIDELIHIGQRMRAIALQNAIGGMGLSFVGMLFAVAGNLPPVAGAIEQEIIDVAAVLNALRMAFPLDNLGGL